MAIDRKDLKIIIPMVLFLILGLCLVNSHKYIESSKALKLAPVWGSVPAAIMSAYLAYTSVYKYGKSFASWRKIVGVIASFIIFTLVAVVSVSGYLIFFNSHFGIQKNILIKGEVIKLDYPKRKKPLNTYSIQIITEGEGKKIKLDVPSNEYFVGQIFEKGMSEGSLGIIYGR